MAKISPLHPPDVLHKWSIADAIDTYGVERWGKDYFSINGSGNGHHYYSHLYLAQALYQRGGEEWDQYYARISEWLLRQQRRDGSWTGDGVGTIYGTSIALTILQLPYAYVR